MTKIIELRHIYENLNLGVPIAIGEDASMDPILVVNSVPLDAPGTLKAIEDMSNEAKVKYLNSVVGSPIDVETTLSNFNDMKETRAELFEEWFEEGRPDTHVVHT